MAPLNSSIKFAVDSQLPLGFTTEEKLLIELFYLLPVLCYHRRMRQWYLIYTKPRQELIAVANLQNQGYTAFAPQLSVKKRTNQGWKQVNEPLFPNYVFVQLDDVTDDWKPIRSTRGVSGFVRFGSGMPVPIRDELMQPLFALDLMQVGERLSAQPKVGDRVSLPIGDTWVSALVTAENAKGRVEVLLTLLGREQSLWVDVHCLKPDVPTGA